jgi:hypothetical protein
MKILDVLQRKAIIDDLKSQTKKEIIEELVVPVASAVVSEFLMASLKIWIPWFSVSDSAAKAWISSPLTENRRISFLFW